MVSSRNGNRLVNIDKQGLLKILLNFRLSQFIAIRQFYRETSVIFDVRRYERLDKCWFVYRDPRANLLQMRAKFSRILLSRVYASAYRRVSETLISYAHLSFRRSSVSLKTRRMFPIRGVSSPSLDSRSHWFIEEFYYTRL